MPSSERLPELEAGLAAVRSGDAREGLRLLRAIADRSVEARVHAGIAAMSLDAWADAAPLLASALEGAEELRRNASPDSIPPECSLSLLLARTLLGVAAEARTAPDSDRIGQLSSTAALEPAFQPLAALCRLALDFGDRAVLQDVARLAPRGPTLGGAARDREAAELLRLCFEHDGGRPWERVADTVRFFIEGPEIDRAAERWRANPRASRAALGARRWWPRAAQLALAFLLRGLDSRPASLSQHMRRLLLDPPAHRRTVLVPPADPDGRDWLALRDVYRRTLIEAFRRRVPGPEGIFLASTKGAESLNLYRLVAQQRPATSLQVGVFVGLSAAVLARALEDHATADAHLHLVDANISHAQIPAPLEAAQRVVADLAPSMAGRVHFHEGYFATGYAATPGTLPEARPPHRPVVGRTVLEALPGPVDFAFIDGDHALPAFLADTTLVYEFAARGAALVLHDVRLWPGVALGIELLAADPSFNGWGVGMAARADFCEVLPSSHDGLCLIRVRITHDGSG